MTSFMGMGLGLTITPPNMKIFQKGKPQGCIRREGASEAVPEAVRRAVGGGCQAVGRGYCWLQMPLKLALGVRGTVAGHRLGTVEEGGGVPLPFPMHPCSPRPSLP